MTGGRPATARRPAGHVAARRRRRGSPWAEPMNPWLGGDRGFLAGWITQRWVRLTRRRIALAEAPWLRGPVAAPTGVAEDEFERGAHPRVLRRAGRGAHRPPVLALGPGLPSPALPLRAVAFAAHAASHRSRCGGRLGSGQDHPHARAGPRPRRRQRRAPERRRLPPLRPPRAPQPRHHAAAPGRQPPRHPYTAPRTPARGRAGPQPGLPPPD